MLKRKSLCLALLLTMGGGVTIAQTSQFESRPELDVYLSLSEQARMVFQNSFVRQRSIGFTEGKFAYFLDFALRPVFRQKLRNQDDVFRRRFLSFRAGYQFTEPLGGTASTENRGILELTPRYPLPGKLILVDRNRGELRWVRGQAFSGRYRNRLWLERDCQVGWLVFTPYLYDEVFYDSRSGAITQNRYAAGIQLPAGLHVVFDTYFRRQDQRQAPSRNAIGLTLNLYF